MFIVAKALELQLTDDGNVTLLPLFGLGVGPRRR